MALNAQIGLKQRGRLALSPLMRRSIMLLRLPTQSVGETIAREAEENPFLVVEPATSSGSAYDYALATVAAPESMSENLRRQISLQTLDPTTEAAAFFLMGELREDGYLDESLEEIADRTGVDPGILAQGLFALQNCEPGGIGARTLVEYVGLRLREIGLDDAAAIAAASRLEDFAQGNWSLLERRLGIRRTRLTEIAAFMRSLPAAPIETGTDWCAATVPEISIERVGESGLSVSLLPSVLPGISVMAVNRDMLDTAALREMLDRASQFRDALSARSETLLRIGHFLAATQSAFFLGDHTTIAPITRNDAATDLAMHPSTLGRALSGKAVLADNRVYPLSMFFARALPGAEKGISPFDVQRRIRSLIASEPAGTPLADEAICAQLRKEGVDIARRTVAKYRKCMRIPSSFGRRHRKVSDKNQPRDARKKN
jgi:RNA polymerase sigma-54 factor